jgi:hypothetical protein
MDFVYIICAIVGTTAGSLVGITLLLIAMNKIDV